MSRPFVKICGLTRPEDAALALELGATHLGSVLVPSSPRCARLEQARAIAELVGDACPYVLVFKNARAAEILETARSVGARWVQLYGASTATIEAIERAGLRVVRAVDVAPDATSPPAIAPAPTAARPALLDVGGGGSGRSFRWEILRPRGDGPALPFTFVAGGVRPETIADLVAMRPWGVDLSSGVEREPGVKDPDRLRLFFERLEESLASPH